MISLLNVGRQHFVGRGQMTVLDGVSIDIKSGEKVCLVGANGSGKTTLMRIILGIETPDSGRVIPTISNSRLRVSYVPQDYRNALFPWLSLRKNLTLSSANGHSSPAHASTLESFEELSHRFKVSIDLSKFPYQLSGGEQQIFLLIRAAISEPDVLFLDEPLSAVDFARRFLIHDYLSIWFSRKQVTVVFASHDLEESVLFSDRVVILDKNSGRLLLILPVPLEWPRRQEMVRSSAFGSTMATILGSLA